jgi:hypothetical protein
MAFDPATSQVYGTPWVSGVFTFQVTVTVTNTPALSKTYLFTIAKSGEILPPHSDIDTSETPLKSGTTTSGVFDNGTTATVVATPANGYAFAGWWDNGTLASTSATYEFTAALNRSLVAKFVPVPPIFLRPSLPGVISLQWPTNFTGFVIQANADLASTNWVNATNPVITSGSNYQALIQTTNRAQYFRLQHP